MSRICPATVGKVRWKRKIQILNSSFLFEVLKNGYFMLSIDGSSADDGSDCFCYHSSSRLIFPINFSRLNEISLSPPLGYQAEFQWEKYLRENNSVYAPKEIFKVVQVRKFRIETKISFRRFFSHLGKRKNVQIRFVSEWRLKPSIWWRRI